MPLVMPPRGMSMLSGPDGKAPGRPVREVSSKELEAYCDKWEGLKQDRNTWDAHWRDLADFILPRRYIFSKDWIGKGTKRNEKIINSTATRAARISAAGMMAGITSPSRRWWMLTTPDPEMAEYGPVRSWLNIVEERQRTLLTRSNVYNALAGGVYPDVNVFGSTCALLEEDDADIFRAYSIAVGMFCLASSERGEIDTIGYEERLTTVQLVERFGYDAVSIDVRNAYDRGDYKQVWDILRFIEPNRQLQLGRADWRGMRWTSCWMEVGAKHCLRMKGYHEFPGLTPRWSLTMPTDAYGTSPGMNALGDVKALQSLEEDKAKLIQKTSTPPVNASEGAQALGAVSTAPNAINWTPAGGQPVTPALVLPPAAIEQTRLSIREHEERINSEFFADLWMALSMDDRAQRATAREVDERHEEKMHQLGPVLERLSAELLQPLIERSYHIMERRGLIPPPPKELEGSEVRIEFLSIMHQAQKMLGIAGVRTLVQETMSLAAVWPEVKDKLNADEVVDELAAMMGTKPDLVYADDVVEQKRAARARAEAEAKAMEAVPVVAGAAKTLSQADTSSQNALTQMMGQLPGVAQDASGVPPFQVEGSR